MTKYRIVLRAGTYRIESERWLWGIFPRWVSEGYVYATVALAKQELDYITKQANPDPVVVIEEVWI